MPPLARRRLDGRDEAVRPKAERAAARLMGALAGAPDVQSAARAWLDYLLYERRMSALTAAAYATDAAFFAEFLRAHFGAPPVLRRFDELTPADLRAFLSHRRKQRGGMSARTLARTLASVRSFLRHLQKHHGVSGG